MHNRGWVLIGSLAMLMTLLKACGGGPPPISFTVNTADDVDNGACNATHCSLREAIHAANASPGFNGIYFKIPGTGVHVIETSTGFPEIIDPVTIDATTQPGWTGTPLIELRSSWSQHQTAFLVHGGSSTIKGFSIVDFNSAVEITGQGNVWVIGNYIGLQPDGATAQGNHYALRIWTAENHIGGPQADYRNVISGNTDGIEVECQLDKNLIQNNLIGLNAAGNAAVGNAEYGIHICGSHNTIGGTDVLAGNIVSGNGGNGIEIQAAVAFPASDNTVEGNYVGTDLCGFTAVPNAKNGIFIQSDGNMIVRNKASGNAQNGIQIDKHQGNLLTGNYVGINAAGALAVPNGGDGISLTNASNNWIGGGGAGAGNVASGNLGAGIRIAADPGAVATANGVQGNKIGTDNFGLTAVPNQIGIVLSASGDTIGGPAYDARNLISGNAGDGLRIGGSLNVIQQNYVGTDAGGVNPLGNGGNGINLVSGAAKNSIGTEGAGNTIAFNQGAGVAALTGAGTQNRIQRNSIHDNGGLGIALGNASPPLPNDAGDADTGPNQLMNYPVMLSAVSMYNSQFKASFNGAPGSAVQVEFFTVNACDPSGYGEGQRWMKTVSITTDINGAGLAIATFPSTYFSSGNYITATAIDADGNTSEFSNCIQVVQATPTPHGTLTPTFSPTFTPTAMAKSLFTVKLSAPKIYFGGTTCGDKQEKFEVNVAQPEKVAGVWLFVRLKNKAGDGNTDWSEALVMTPEGSGWYAYTLLSENIPGFAKYKDAYVQYQFVAYDKSFASLAKSDVLWDVELMACGAIYKGPG